MPRKNTRKNFKKIRGGADGENAVSIPSTSYFSMPSMPSMSSFSMPSMSSFSMPELPSWLGGPEKKIATTGGKKRKMRGGSYSPNSSYYGSNAGSYSGSPTARAQAYVGGRRTRRKKSKY
jgi:hypothetical protein